jgi:hypothetical protein
MKRFVLMFGILIGGVTLIYAQDDEFDIEMADETNEYGWRTPAGEYLDPSSFFSLHGYVNAVYATQSADWNVADPTQLAGPGQLLVPNTTNSSFQYDFAMVISSEISERTRIAIESHYVAHPSGIGNAGPGGLTIAITEATASFDIIPNYLTISGGLFWSPFGIINNDWLGAQNDFSLIPRASGAYPVHFNERGVRLNGAFELGDGVALNYVASVGNGLATYDISGQGSYDQNNGKTVTGRVGFFPGLGKDLDIGLSFMNGDLRDEENIVFTRADVWHYASEAEAIGVDATYIKNNLKLKAYYISGKEILQKDALGNDPGNINRDGFMFEGSYLIKIGADHLAGIAPKVRYDYIKVDNLEEIQSELQINNYDTNTISFGANVMVNDNFRFSFDHNIIGENSQEELSNDRSMIKIIAKF